jgi:hypothetical protein
MAEMTIDKLENMASTTTLVRLYTFSLIVSKTLAVRQKVYSE